MSICEKENIITPSRKRLWTVADDAKINVNDVRLIAEKLNELKWNAFLKEHNVDFHVKEK